MTEIGHKFVLMVEGSEDEQLTFIKPQSSYYNRGFVIQIFEDAYGTFDAKMVLVQTLPKFIRDDLIPFLEQN